MQRRDPQAFARQVAARRSEKRQARRWFGPAALFVAAAAALLLVWLRSEPAIRYKGGHSFQVFVQQHGAPELLADGQALAAGDQLAFAYSLSEPRYLLLLSIDDTGEITKYYPVDAASESPLRPAARAPLSVGVELDAHRGEERLVALFSREPLDEARVRDALRAALQEARAHGPGIANMGALALHAEQTSVWFRKP